MARGEIDNARGVFTPNVAYRVADNHRLSDTFRGPDAVIGYFGRLIEMTDGSYRTSAMDWLIGDESIGLVTRNHARRNGIAPAWDEIIRFTFVDGRKSQIELFSGDPYGVDALLASCRKRPRRVCLQIAVRCKKARNRSGSCAFSVVRIRIDVKRRERRFDRRAFLERVAGIEPATLAWKARALPLCNTRGRHWAGRDSNPRTACRTDLQSVAFNHSATYPRATDLRYGPEAPSPLVRAAASNGERSARATE